MSQENSFLEGALKRLTQAIENIVELKVTTTVLDGDTETMKVVTSVNLVGGDINTQLPAEFFSEENASLKAFHEAKETQAKAIIDGNLTQLVTAAKTLAEVIKS